MIKVYWLFFFCVLSESLSDVHMMEVPKKHFKVHAFKPCDLEDKPHIHFNESSFRATGAINKLVISGQIELIQDEPGPLHVMLNTTVCHKINGDCEQKDIKNFDDLCVVFHLPFFSFTGLFTPPIKECPVKKNVYIVNDVDYDMTSHTAPAMNEMHVKTKLHVFNPAKEKVLCIYYEWSRD